MNDDLYSSLKNLNKLENLHLILLMTHAKKRDEGSTQERVKETVKRIVQIQKHDECWFEVNDYISHQESGKV